MSPAPAIGHWQWNLLQAFFHADAFCFGIACTVIFFVSVVEPPTTFVV
jgi:hypothetical protein